MEVAGSAEVATALASVEPTMKLVEPLSLVAVAVPHCFTTPAAVLIVK